MEWHDHPMKLPPLEADTAVIVDFDEALLTPARTAGLANLCLTLSVLHGETVSGVGILSGHEVGLIDQLFAPVRMPLAAGMGWQVRGTLGGPLSTLSAPPGLGDLEEQVREMVGPLRGVRIDRTVNGLIVTCGGNGKAAAQCSYTLHRLLSTTSGFKLFSMGRRFDFLPAAANKAMALERLVDAAHLNDRRLLVISDNLSAEDAFRKAQERRGVGVRVGHRTTTARHHVSSWQVIDNWLSGCVASLHGTRLHIDGIGDD